MSSERPARLHPCKGEDGLGQQLALYHCYYNFCLPHASLRRHSPARAHPGTGAAKVWRRHARDGRGIDGSRVVAQRSVALSGATVAATLGTVVG